MLADLAQLPGDKGTEVPVTNGAIYQGNVQGGGGLELLRDHRVWQVGDIVTVQIVQNASATKNVSQNIGHIAYNSANTLQGSGATAQSDTFATTVSTMVQRIRPNGDLVIAGTNEVKLVGGKEFIRIAGVVRPEDLSGNVAQSTQMAEAHIEFSGDGETYLSPKMGFLQRLFLTVSTAWPGEWF
jgi:flagellar L-ring protein FlgH